MQDIYDLVIYGSGLQAAALFAEAQDKGLKTALVCETDIAENHNVDAIKFSQTISKKFLFFRIHRHYPEIQLAKAAPHLLIHSVSIQKMQVNSLIRILTGIYNIFHKNEIRIHKSPVLQGVKYNTLKFLPHRISILLVNQAVKNGADLFLFTSLTSSQFKGRKYLFNFYDKIKGQDFILKSNSVLIHQSANQCKEALNKHHEKSKFHTFLTYPASHVDLKRNLLFSSQNAEIQIIPWFDNISISIVSDKILNQQEAIDLICHSGFIRLQNRFIQYFQQIERYKNSSDNCYTFFYEGKQYLYHSKNTAGLFNFAYKTIIGIVKQIHAGHNGRPLLNTTTLPGGRLEVDHHPLRIMELADIKYDMAKQILKSPVHFKKLFYRYGTEVDRITDRAYEYRNTIKNNDLSWLKAEIWYCMHYEMCKTPQSFMQTHTSIWIEGDQNLIQQVEKFFKEIQDEIQF